jgi:predicted regulator of Ras-like GTPase activity (Roadblock/LC7/MglB family)
MEANAALADLLEVSTQIRAAVILDDSARPVAATFGDASRIERAADAARRLLTEAEQVLAGDRPVTQVEVDLGEDAVFVVREGPRAIAGVTGREPTVGLVFYDLRSCLRSLDREDGHAAS